MRHAGVGVGFPTPFLAACALFSRDSARWMMDAGDAALATERGEEALPIVVGALGPRMGALAHVTFFRTTQPMFPMSDGTVTLPSPLLPRTLGTNMNAAVIPSSSRWESKYWKTWFRCIPAIAPTFSPDATLAWVMTICSQVLLSHAWHLQLHAPPRLQPTPRPIPRMPSQTSHTQ
eukprot:4099208-Prymnesium_polylepis.1